MEEKKEKYYLGLDFSTQQIKGVVIDDDLNVIAEDNVSFDKDLKEYRTHHGFHEGLNGKVTSPTIMWVKGLDLLMERIRIQARILLACYKIQNTKICLNLDLRSFFKTLLKKSVTVQSDYASFINLKVSMMMAPKLCNQVPSLSLSRWRTLTLLKIQIGWVF